MDDDLTVKVSQSRDSFAQALKLRRAVFIVEQSIPSHLDYDGSDQKSWHILATLHSGEVVGCARLTPYQNAGVMARIAVQKKARGNGIASRLIEAGLNLAKSLKLAKVEIHAHEYLIDYYRQFGFEFVSNVEVVGEHQLVSMEVSLP